MNIILDWKEKKKSLYNCKIILDFINEIVNYKPYKIWEIKTIIHAYKYMLLWISDQDSYESESKRTFTSHQSSQNRKY